MTVNSKEENYLKDFINVFRNKKILIATCNFLVSTKSSELQKRENPKKRKKK
jgi:hypothetical protein